MVGLKSSLGSSEGVELAACDVPENVAVLQEWPSVDLTPVPQ